MQNEYDTDARSAPPPPPSPSQPRMRLALPNNPPTVTYLLLGLIVLVYLAGQIIPVQPGTVVKGIRVRGGEELLFVYGAKITEFIVQDGEVYRLLTMIFLHGGLVHLFFNGMALYSIGQQVERIFGHVRFLIIYFLGGLTASVVSVVLNPTAWSVGASGALFAIFGAEMVMLYRNRALFGVAGRAQLNNLVMWLALNVLIGLSSPYIDNWAHIGGFVAGVALAWLITPQFAAPTIIQPEDMAQGVVPLADENPSHRWILVPFLWAAGLVLAVGLLMMGRG